MEVSLTLEQFVTGIIGGTISYPVAAFLFKELGGDQLSSQWKRLLAYVISFALGGAALATGNWLGYVEVTPESIFTACSTAFMTSQALHGLLRLKAIKES